MNPFGHMVSEISSTVIICFFVSEVVLNVGAAEEKEGISIRLPPWTMRAAALLFLPFLNAESSDKHEPLLMKSIPLARTKRANKLLLHHR
jgi:predicted membrane chloride channel (bestrophin family)